MYSIVRGKTPSVRSIETTDLNHFLDDLRAMSADECLEVKAVLRIREQQVQSSMVMREAQNGSVPSDSSLRRVGVLHRHRAGRLCKNYVLRV